MEVDYSTLLIKRFFIPRLGVDYHTFEGRLFYANVKTLYHCMVLQKRFFILRAKIEYSTSELKDLNSQPVKSSLSFDKSERCNVSRLQDPVYCI